MRENKLDAILCAAGSSCSTSPAAASNQGIWVVPAKGEPVWFVPEADEERARGAIRLGAKLHAWSASEGPYKRIGQALAGSARVGIEERVPLRSLRRPAPRIAVASISSAPTRSPSAAG